MRPNDKVAFISSLLGRLDLLLKMKTHANQLNDKLIRSKVDRMVNNGIFFSLIRNRYQKEKRKWDK